MKPSEYTVTGQLVGIAYENWHSILGNNGHRLFWEFFGITKRQMQSFKSTGKLGVRAETARKLRAMGKLRFAEPKYRLALYKAYLAKGDNHVES